MSVHRLLGLAVLSLTLGVFTPPTASADVHQAPPARQTAKTLDDLFSRLKTQYEAQDETGLLATFRAIIAHPDFKTVPNDRQWRIYNSFALALYYLQNDYAGAYEALLKVATYSEADLNADYWFLRTDAAIMLDKDDEAIDAFLVAVRQFPQEVSKSPLNYVSGRVRTARELKDGGTRHRQLLEALYAGGYTQGPDRSVEYLWFDLFEYKVIDGDTAGAKALSETFSDVKSLIKLAIDKRFTGYRTISDDDIITAYETQIEQARSLTANNPRLLEGPVLLSERLNTVHRHDEALTVIETALNRIDSTPKDKLAFDDLDGKYNWALNQRASVLDRLGRFDDAEAALTKARDVSIADGRDMISQRVNLADLYVEHGKPQLALKALPDTLVKNASVYGAMAAEGVRVCAWAQTGESEKIAPALSRMRENAGLASGPLQSALLCVNDLDGAARALIERLDDPKTRADTLLRLQIYEPHTIRAPQVVLQDERFDALVARPNVQAAVAKYGYIRKIPNRARP